MKKIITITLAGLFVFGSLGAFTRAQETSKETAAEIKAVDAGNEICPVSGEEIDDKLKATYEYKGKIYNFCCASCIDEFKKDPEKYIKKVEEELQSKSKEESGHEEREMMMRGYEAPHQGMHEGHHH